MSASGQTGNKKIVPVHFYRVLTCIFLFLMFSGALAVPWLYETQTIWYKFGHDKTLLRMGQTAGLLALCLLLVQILLAVRGSIFDSIFNRALLVSLHRYNALLITLMALLHILLVLVPEGLTNLPIGKKYWPEMIGGALFIILLLMVVSSQFRQQLNLKYNLWKIIHQILGYLVLTVILLHVCFVSESFASGPPRHLLIIIVLAVLLWSIVTKILILFTNKGRSDNF